MFFTRLKCAAAFHTCGVTHDLLLEEEIIARNSVVVVVTVVKAQAFHRVHCVPVSIPDFASTSNVMWLDHECCA